MVVNLCLPHFHTTVHSNKLSADGYDVTNLVADDPALRRRGFKLEYFLRPPVQVTLTFGFQVDLCRVDVELWPWGMDRGQASKRLEISTSSDPLPSGKLVQGHQRFRQKEHVQMRVKDQNDPKERKVQEHHGKSQHSDGHQWSCQAQQWARESLDEHQHAADAHKRQAGKERAQTNAQCGAPEPEFKLVGRCELKEETPVCFSHSSFRPRPPFLSPPPPKPANCRQEDLWSRGPLSLGAVTQLRVTVPFGGAASALGFKALTVWGQPARCCPAGEVERIKTVHVASQRQLPQLGLFSSTVGQTQQQQQPPPPRAAALPGGVPIPEEFLDSLTQELMTLPMLLPSGVSVDHSSLDEYQKREATWGRPPNDPFTGVPFTSTSQPLPNPQLKTRIDHFLLQGGGVRRDGTLGRRGPGEDPQASRLIASGLDGPPYASPFLSKSSPNSTAVQYNVEAGNTSKDTGLGCSFDNHTTNSQRLTTDNRSEFHQRNKRDLSGNSRESAEEKQLLPQTKRPRNDAGSVPSCSSHEQRLSASLDEALHSALQGRPSFTSNLAQRRRLDSEPLSTTQQCQTLGTSNVCSGEKTCSACSCSVSAYATAASPVYRLTCAHLLCRACLRSRARDPNSATAATSIVCPTCQRPSLRTDITRVHH